MCDHRSASSDVGAEARVRHPPHVTAHARTHGAWRGREARVDLEHYEERQVEGAPPEEALSRRFVWFGLLACLFVCLFVCLIRRSHDQPERHDSPRDTQWHHS